jgi:ABC-type Fe3+ transport system substrate-binding protein
MNYASSSNNDLNADERQNGALIMLTRWLGLSALIIAFTAGSAASKSLDSLIAEAQKEGGLRAQVIDTAGPEAGKIAEAFSKRFGLSNVTIATENESTAFQKAETAIRTGSAPDFDVMVGEDGNVFSFIKKGYLTKVDDWQTILPGVNPNVASGKDKPDQVSPEPFGGYAFLVATRDESIVYNSRLINASDLPNTHVDLGDPKYKGKFNLPPWSTTFTLGMLIYPKENWVQTVDAIGKNAGAVLFPSVGLNRILQGDFAFAPMNYLYYATAKARDSNVPLGAAFFKDGIFTYRVLYGVPKGSKHAASGMLFALWMTSDESRDLMRPSLYQENVETGHTTLDEEVSASMKATGAKVLGWFTNAKAQSEFEWLTTTEDGSKYNQAIGQALTQRK